jgi:hypothetical protein
MLFLSKQDHGNEPASNKDNCLSILGFLLSIGIIGGIGLLIYGKI